MQTLKELKTNEAGDFTDNELIHRFMDGDWKKENFQWRPGASRPMTLDDLDLYRTSWNWLMPVVDKIEDMGYYFTICRWTCSVSEEWKDETKHGISTDSKINAVYKSVVTFVRWYSRGRG